MAAPASMTTANISGTYVMNKKLSGNTDECLSLQGVGWITRKGISVATVTIKIKHTTDEHGVETIDIANTVTGGLPGTEELRILNDVERTSTDHLWGLVQSKNKRVKVADVEEAYLRDGWMTGGPENETLIYCESASVQNGWTAYQTWGFEEVNGVKHHARHLKLVAKKGTKTVFCKMIYDYYP